MTSIFRQEYEKREELEEKSEDKQSRQCKIQDIETLSGSAEEMETHI